MSRKQVPRCGHDYISGIAERYNVSHQTVWLWSKTPNFPKPSGFVSSVPVFSLDDIRFFVDNHLSSRRNIE